MVDPSRTGHFQLITRLTLPPGAAALAARRSTLTPAALVKRAGLLGIIEGQPRKDK